MIVLCSILKEKGGRSLEDSVWSDLRMVAAGSKRYDGKRDSTHLGYSDSELH